MGRAQLRTQIGNSFNLEELHTLCFDLGVNFDNLSGQSIEAKASALIEYFERRRQLDALLATLQKQRPEVDWAAIQIQFSEETSNNPSSGNEMQPPPISSISSAIAALGIAIIWFFKDPGFEPLLAVLAGLVTAGGLKKADLPRKLDLALAVGIVTISLAGGIYIFLSPANSAPNNAPTIHNLIANRTTIAPGETATITVEATDKDGDPLTYIWSAGRGHIPGGSRGPQIIYTAPMEPGAGLDTVRVTVSDGKGGGSSTQELTIVIEYQD